MPYFPLGYPDRESSREIIRAVAQSGADLIELGVPFSDPLADGPTIQHATQVALEQGSDTASCLSLVADLRQAGVHQPLILMAYANPVYSFGIERFVRQAGQAGADGVIVPDLPPEEAEELRAACQAQQLALIFLLPPNATGERARQLAQATSGFLYLVSLTGVTGTRKELPADLAKFVRQVRGLTPDPLAVGFGVSTPEQVGAIGALADGVIVGSALIEAVNRALHSGGDPIEAARSFIGQLHAGTGRKPAA
jgi:tryptophan synthase alpha chain